MRKLLTLILLVGCALPGLKAQIALEECIKMARDNYPLIKKYNLISQTCEINLSDINKSWLPAISLYGQGTIQNIVPSFPDALSGIMSHTGVAIQGMEELQYKVGADISQTIWDGGISQSRRKIERAQENENSAAIDMQLYNINERVQNLFFGILLIDEQIKQTDITLTLLKSNIGRMEAMHRNGTAMQSDVDMLRAQYLTVSQQLIQAKSATASYRKLLGLYVGKSLDGLTLLRPAPDIPADLSPDTPRLRYFDAQLATNSARQSAVDMSVMPRIGAFAQAYYGYPGFNYFQSMMNHDLSFNIIAGIKVSWSLDSFYTKNNSRRKLDLAAESIHADREAFLFNTGLQASSQLSKIDEIRKVMADDNLIVELRRNVRRASESQLENGIIDATALLAKITEENQARLNACYHEIELLQNIYKLKHILNR